MSTHSRSAVHREMVLEEHLVNTLISAHRYIERAPTDFDQALAMDRELVFQFVKGTQAEEWTKLEAQYAAPPRPNFSSSLKRP